MTNVVALISEAVMTRLARWLRVGILVVCIGPRMPALFTRRIGAAWWISVGALPPVWQQRLDAAVHLRGRLCQHVLQVGPGLVPFELGLR
jgi:hypothetical protein